MSIYAIVKTSSTDLYNTSSEKVGELSGSLNSWTKKTADKLSSGAWPPAWNTSEYFQCGSNNKYMGAFEFPIPLNSNNTRKLDYAVISIDLISNEGSWPANCRCYLLSGSPKPDAVDVSSALSIGYMYTKPDCKTKITDTSADYRGKTIYTKVDLSKCSKNTTYTACFLENVDNTSPNGYMRGAESKNETITIMAKDDITITYKPGTNGVGSQQTQSAIVGESCKLNGAIFTRTGYVQTGWSTGDGGTKTYELSESVTLSASTTLYPFWERSKNVYVATGSNKSASGIAYVYVNGVLKPGITYVKTSSGYKTL